MKTISFKQVMVIPALTTLGLGSLLYAQQLSLDRPVNAAPLSSAPESFMLAQAEPSQATAPFQLAQAAADPALQGVEFGGAQPPHESNPNQIRATSRNELVRQARESAGREDPFVALLNPNPAVIVPLPLAAAPVLSEDLEPLPTLPAFPGKPGAVSKGQSGGKPGPGNVSLPAPNVYYDRGVAYEIPAWNVSGILNTGRDAVAILEKNGSIREVRVNEILDDGTKVVKIDSSSVMLLKQGRRYAKTIGGAE